jgi:two-component system sensor histidine kinase/response regulator
MSTPAPERLGNILVVDDTPANLRLLTHMLTEHGYYARPVLDGAQALATAQTAPPDLILLDIRMPGMDGYVVCQRLKADEGTREIPVLFISALSETEDKVQAFAAGGVDYITKPFQLEEVLARVQTHLTIRNLRRDLERQIAEQNSLIADLQAYAHSVAHDLRSPISVALGTSELLADADTPMSETERSEFIGLMNDGLRKAANIITELLLLAEVRQADVEVAPVEMAPVVAEAQRRVAALLRDAGATITQPPVWPHALGHAPWIEEIWVNYLTNAVKYGGKPPVIEIGATAQGDGVVRFWVRDNGAGLTAENQATLFAPFIRLERTRATGHGLGLSIVQRIARKLNGEVGVESSGIPGQGSTFFFTLPALERTTDG